MLLLTILRIEKNPNKKHFEQIKRFLLSKVIISNNSPLQVKTWFQNRRMKWKKQGLGAISSGSPHNLSPKVIPYSLVS